MRPSIRASVAIGGGADCVESLAVLPVGEQRGVADPNGPTKSMLEANLELAGQTTLRRHP